ncbi:recombinase family protein [Bradyrhizobium sp. SSUT77]|uniref:recombinase family protein n=1 Tax=Bradyrhizobium sp. SSUT77 TaxID=3040603 RepID=UPI00244C29FA|nr:recombinase family protein [Bradyrhizobium sp. SSUT77]MDH2349018.1 recombinase family protein [Bradyrhizobium sp. SSUT77]
MSLEVWRALPAELQQAIIDDLATVLGKVNDEFGSHRVAPSSGGRRSSTFVSRAHIRYSITMKACGALSQRARDLRWHESNIDVIDAHLGMSGAAATHRRGFKELFARLALGEIGLILSIELTRLARNCSDCYQLFDVCSQRGCLIAERDGIYDRGTPNGRLLLGLKGTISELELHTIRGRSTAGLLEGPTRRISAAIAGRLCA